MNFYDRYVELCSKAGKTPSRAAMDIGISKSIVSNWKNRGSTPTDIVVYKIADYFGVTPSELLREETKKDPAQGAEPKTNEFINLYASLNPEQQAKVEAFAKFLQMERKE